MHFGYKMESGEDGVAARVLEWKVACVAKGTR